MALLRRKQLHVEGSGPYTLHQTDIKFGGTETPEHIHVGTTAPTDTPYDGQLWCYTGAGTDGTELYSYDGHRSAWLSTRTVYVTFSVHPDAVKNWRAYLWFGANPSNNDTVTVDSNVYTFKTTLSTGPTVPGEVLIGANASESARNLSWAMNNTVWEAPAGSPTDESSNYYTALGTPAKSFYAVAYMDNASATIDSAPLVKVVAKDSSGTALSVNETMTEATSVWLNYPDLVANGATSISGTTMVRNGNALRAGEFFCAEGTENSYVDYGWPHGLSSDGSTDDKYRMVTWHWWAPEARGANPAALAIQLLADGVSVGTFQVSASQGVDYRYKHRNVADVAITASANVLSARLLPTSTCDAPPGAIFAIGLRKEIS